MITQNTIATIKGTINVSENIKVDIECVDKNHFIMTDQNKVNLNVYFNEELGFYTEVKTDDMVNFLKTSIKNEEMVSVLSLFRENLLKEQSIFKQEYDESEDFEEEDEIYESSYHELDEDYNEEDDEGFY